MEYLFNSKYGRERRASGKQKIIPSVSKQFTEISFLIKLLLSHDEKWTDLGTASVIPIAHTWIANRGREATEEANPFPNHLQWWLGHAG